MRTPLSLGLAAAVAAAWTSAGTAHAQPARLAYEAPASCPDASAFVKAVRDRDPTIQMAVDGPASRTLTVSVASVLGFLSGTLEWNDSGTVSASRRVEARQCDEVFSALVLMTALVLAPQARGYESKGSATSIGRDPRPVQAALGSPGDALWDGLPSRGMPVSELAVGTQAIGAFLILPRALLGAGAMANWTADARGAWSAELRLEVLAGSTGPVETSSPEGHGSSDYRLLTGLLDACMLHARLGSGWGLTPHVGLQVGSLWAQGQGPLIVPVSRQLLWLVATAGARLGYDVGARVTIELDVQTLWPLRRHEFHFDEPEIPIYEQPVIGLMTGIGFAYRVW